MVPIYIAVAVLKHTPVVPWLSKMLSPAMGWFGLPGRAAIALVVGNVINLYAGIGAMVPLQLDRHEVTVLGLMLGISHSLPIETAVLRKMGIPIFFGTGLRLGAAVVAGLLAHMIGT
ncbi:MAG: nucleoside recognition protein [Armatimonadetes bacterium]|nr:nucleoside recognition protein [Armatimonadota bacterium]